MKNILISGYYGFNNAGDEAILNALCQLFSHDHVKISVLASPDIYASTPDSVEAIPRMDPWSIIKALKNTDLFISGGGGLFQDVTGWGSIPYYGGLLYLAKKMNIATLIFGQGIGPVRHSINRKLLRFLIKDVQQAAVRDPASLEALKRMRIPADKLSLTADPVLTLDPMPKHHIQEALVAEGIDLSIPIIGVSIRPWNDWFEKQLKSFTSVLIQFALENQAQIIFIPFQPQTDTWICQEAAYSMCTRPNTHCPPVHVLQNTYTPREMMGIIGFTKLIVGMRLHSLIMGARMLTPGVGVAYDPKVQLFSDSVEYSCIPSVSDLTDSDSFYDALSKTWADRSEIENALSKKLPLLQERVYDSVQLALKLLET